MYILPKAGRLATAAYTDGRSAIKGFPFGKPPVVEPPSAGGMVTSPTSTVANVQGTQFDTATIRNAPALTTGGHIVRLVNPTGRVPQIGPHEKGSVLKRVVVPTSKRQFGGGSNGEADTPFHPKPEREQKNVRVSPAPDVSKISIDNLPSSFASRSNLWSDPNNSFYRGADSVATGAAGRGRWSVVKKGVV